MKRVAEKQLTKDNEEAEEEENEEGFKKADDAVLATRVIRGLPKSRNRPQNEAPPSPFAMPPASTGSANPFGLPQSTTTTSPFGNFSLKPPVSDFTFKPTTTEAKETSSSSPSPFSAPSLFSFATPQKSSFTFGPSTQNSSPPTVASTASNTSKAFASLINSTAPPSSFTSPPHTIPATSTQNGDKSSPDPVSLKYYTNLRGLNVSFLAAVSKAVDEDPFIDIAGVFESYKSTRARVQKEFDDLSSTKARSTAESTSSPQPTTNSGPTMPAPPASFSFGGFKPTPAALSTPAATSLAPKPSFEFKPSTGFGSTSAANPFAPSSKDSSSSSSSSIFGSSSISNPADKSSESTAKPTAGGSSLFTFEKPPSAPSPFGTFGTSAPVPFSFGSGTSASGDKSTSAPSSFFGGSNKTTSSNASSSFTFGTSGGSATPSVFGGMKPLGGEGSTESTGEAAGEVENSDRATPATEGGDAEQAPPLIATNPWTEEGEGEENEETLHAVKAKAYKMAKADDGSSKWATLGAGIIRLKKDKDSGTRRMLLRNATNGKVVINFNIYAGLKPTQTKTALSFVGHDAGASQTYTIRLANEGDANEFKNALDREIAFVKAKDES